MEKKAYGVAGIPITRFSVEKHAQKNPSLTRPVSIFLSVFFYRTACRGKTCFGFIVEWGRETILLQEEVVLCCFLLPNMVPFSTPEKIQTDKPSNTLSPAQSLGSGRLSPDGYVVSFSSFSSSPRKQPSKASNNYNNRSNNSISSSNSTHHLASTSMESYSHISLSQRFLRRSSLFLRVADLGMDDCTSHMISTSASDSTSGGGVEYQESHPHYYHPANDPPPGVEHDPKEQWVALNDSAGLHAPIAPLAIERLADFGLITSLNTIMWCPDTKTDRILRDGCPVWMKSTFKPGKVDLTDVKGTENEVLVWTGCFKHGLYGSDLPAIRTAGIVAMPPKALFDLLVDSDRVQEYNKISLGRKDLQVFQDDMFTEGPFGKSITKIMRGESKPPMVRKTLVFLTLLHAKELIDGSGYSIVTRAVHHPNDAHAAGNSIQSEILIGVNLIRKIQGSENRCLMINVGHIRSPVPMMIAKRIGVSAAVGFINDIRACC